MKTKHILALTAFSLLAATSAFSSDADLITVDVSGLGRPMIFIPGLATPGAVWDDTVAHFSDSYECHVLSLAGFGGTPAQPADGPMLEAVREELAAYITEHDLDHPAIIGHSLGGFLALDLSIHHPELTGQLVIVDSLPFIFGIMQPGATAADAKQAAMATASAFSQMDPDAYAGMIRNGPNGSTMAASEEDIDRIIGWGLASDGPTVAKALGELYSADLRSELSKIGSPTLVLAAWIGYAPYTNHDSAAQTYRQQYAELNNVQIAITDTARHFIMLDEPEWMFARIETFLSTSGSANSSN